MPGALLASKRSVSLLRMPGRMILALACALGIGGSLAGAESISFTSGRVVEGIVTAEMWAQRADFSGSFPIAGRMIAEVTGLPADCAVQIGSQGFSASGSPVDWTDGEPGKPVRHAFTVEAGQAGVVWVMIRNRAGSVSLGDWAGVSCSAAGPWYTLPRSGAAAVKGPTEFEGRPVHGPIKFAFRAGPEAAAAAAKPPGAPDGGDDSFLYDAGLGCGFEVPPGWRVESPNATTRHVRAPAGDPGEAVRLEVRVVAGPAGASATVHLQRLHEERVGAGAELHVMGPLTVAGSPAMFAAHQLPAGRQSADTVVTHGGRGYLIVCEGRPDLLEAAMPVYRLIVGSFSFEARAAAPELGVGG
jgi:hypothetical protein